MGEHVMRRIGIGLTVLAGLFWTMDAGMKLAGLPQVVETLGPLGWPTDRGTILALGVIQATSLALYLIPRTSVLGAVLLTGYLGGAIAIHLRVGSPLPSHTFFGIYVALVTWGGLWLRDAALRRLFPVRALPKD